MIDPQTWKWCDDCDHYHGPGGCDPSSAAMRESAQKEHEDFLKLAEREHNQGGQK